MATSAIPGVAGRRLLEERKKRRLTAEELAAQIPDSSLTKTVITNIESGRKKDMTVTELMQIATAMGVSPLDLLIGRDDPFAQLGYPGLPDPYVGMCAAEYSALVEPGRHDRTRWGRTVSLFRILHGLESILYSHTTIEDNALALSEDLADPEAVVGFSNGLWRVWVRQHSLTEDTWRQRVSWIARRATPLQEFIDGPDVALIEDKPELVARIASALERARQIARAAEYEVADGAPADSAE